MGFSFLWNIMALDKSDKWLNQGFKGGLYSGTVSVYVITLGFTLCLVLAVKAGQDRVTCPHE